MTVAPMVAIGYERREQTLLAEALREIACDIPIYFFPNVELMLSSLGRSPIEAKSELPSPRLVLFEFEIAEGNWLDELTRLKSHALLACVPTVALSGLKRWDDIRLAYASGLNSFVPKSTTFEELLLSMKRLIDYWYYTAAVPPQPPSDV